MTEFAKHLQNALGANYQLDHELTGGGMSRVFVAVDQSLGRNVVVKVLPPELAAGVNRERFRREIQVAAQLQHPHIVPLLAAGEDGDLLWYTMPFIEGESLKAALERGRTFSIRDVIRILHDVVDALAFAHARGVIHRDIKPANILTQGAHALVADFGVAKALSAAMPIGGITTTGIAIGTPAYMAPEQLAGDANADQRIDIYAVGLLAYELITGLSPFTGASPRETMTAQLTYDPKPLHEVLPQVPRSLSELIMRCLAKDPAGRPQTADAILHELDSMTMPLGITPPETIAKPGRTKRRWQIASSVVIPIAILIVGYITTHRSQATTSARVGAPAATPAAAPESIATAPIAPPAPVVTPEPKQAAKPVISHEDSLQIDKEVQRRVAAMRLRDSVDLARLTAETQRKLMDSIIAANSGTAAAAPSGPRRLSITIDESQAQRGWPQATLLGRAVADSLQRMLGSRKQQFTVVDLDSVKAAVRDTRFVAGVARQLNSDLFVSIQLRPLRGDSGALVVQIMDIGAVPQFQTRIVTGRPVPRNQVLSGLDQVLLTTVIRLDEVSQSPRRR